MVFKYPVCVIGAGLAGSECAFQLARQGIDVALVEMRPKKMSPAHHTDLAAEMVCSNSLRSNDVHNAVGLIKEEMAALDSLIIKAAHEAHVPAGSALAVDRTVFSQFITAELKKFPNLTWILEEVMGLAREGEFLVVKFSNGESLLCSRCVIATGPLTSDSLAQWIREKTENESLYFYDSIAPIVEADSIDMTKAFKASRYDKGDADEGDYINCALDRKQYDDFIAAIAAAELVEVHDFDKAQFFEGCLPIEEMVRRGPQTLSYGPMKPVGLKNPHAPDLLAAAVVQLRQDNQHASLYNMVGFQTRMKWGEQKRIFRTIPGLENAEFVRFGSMHRNTYLCSPVLLGDGLELKNFPGLHFAGQITGCEGYVESAAVGLFVGRHVASQLKTGKDLSTPPATTSLGALIHHILHADPKNYQPMNVNFGLFTALETRFPKKDKKVHLVVRAREDLKQWMTQKIV